MDMACLSIHPAHKQVWLHYNLTASRAGIPFHFLLRDIGQFDNTLEEAISRMNNAYGFSVMT